LEHYHIRGELGQDGCHFKKVRIPLGLRSGGLFAWKPLKVPSHQTDHLSRLKRAKAQQGRDN
jgi:hypothetical protein